jgi:hypothetical protein
VSLKPIVIRVSNALLLVGIFILAIGLKPLLQGTPIPDGPVNNNPKVLVVTGATILTISAAARIISHFFWVEKP